MKTERIIRGVGCPACGGSLEIAEGSRILNCKYCNTALLARGEHGVTKFYVPLKSEKEEITKKILKWFTGFDKARDLKTASKFTELFPVYIPFWRINSQVVGWVLGEVKKQRDKSTHWEKVECKISHRYDTTIPACDIGEFGVKWVDLAGDTILPFEQETLQQHGMTFGVLTTESDALQEAEARFLQWAQNSVRVDRVSFSKIHLLGTKCSIVYYPLWVVRYLYQNRTYQITADAESSDLLYGRAPGNNMYRVLAFLGSVMGANFLLTTLFISGDFDDFKAYLVIALIALGVIYWGYQKFRYGGEVKIEQKDKSAKTGGVEDLLPAGLTNVMKKLGV